MRCWKPRILLPYNAHVALHRRRQPNYQMLIPLLYAPLLPLIRISMRGRFPQHVIDRTFGVGVGVALTHAGYIMFSDSSV
jgi:hypothetical protein